MSAIVLEPISEGYELLFSDVDSKSILMYSDMVALPVYDQRTTSSLNTSDYPSTAAKLVPRKGVTDAWFSSK